MPSAGLVDRAALLLGLRPEHVEVAAPGAAAFEAEAILVERLSDRTFVHARLVDGPEIIAQDIGFSQVRVGDRVGLKIDGAAAHLFDADGRACHAVVP